MTTERTYNSFTEAFGENAELDLPFSVMNSGEAIEHFKSKLPFMDVSCPAMLVQLSMLRLFFYSRELCTADYFNTPDYLYNSCRDFAYKLAHEVNDMMTDVLPTAETRPGVICDVTDTIAGLYGTAEDRNKLLDIFEDVMNATFEVFNEERVIPDIFLLCMLLSFILDCIFEDDESDNLYTYCYDTVLEQMHLIPGLDLEELCGAIKVAVKLITRIRFKLGTDKYASCGTAEKCSTLFSCIKVCEERRTLAENGYDLTEDLAEVFGEDAVIDEDEYFCDEEEEDDDEDYVSGALPQVDPDEYFADEE